jgi:hypothetical protein
LTIDLAPSFLDMASLLNKTHIESFDGISFLPLAESHPEANTDRSFLIEYKGEGRLHDKIDEGYPQLLS